MPDAKRFAATDVAPASVGDVFAMVRAGRATSRSAISRTTGLAPSTASLRVDALVRTGLVVEEGVEDSRGGRRARRLEIAADAGVIAAIEVHADRARLVLADLRGAERSSERLVGIVSDEPAEFVTQIWERIAAGVETLGAPLHGIAIGVPAPVAHPSSRVVTPSFKPTWHDADLQALFAAHTDVPVLVENDANLLALAESVDGGSTELLAVKLGSRIGCGVVVGGRLHRGISGAAGEVSHTPVDGEAMISCACGVEHCLEAVASGAAMVARLSRAGHDITDVASLVDRSRSADPGVNEALRESGTRIGAVLSSIVNFMNPQEVVLGGTLASSSVLVSSVRAELFRRCLPIVSDALEVRAVATGVRPVLRGAVLLALDEALAPARVERLARDLDDASGAA